LIRQTSCIEGLIDALDVSYVIDDKTLGHFIVMSIEQLILRNLEIWFLVKRAGGVKGLLQLCHMGNVAVRILACNELITQITTATTSGAVVSMKRSEEAALKMIEEVLSHQGLLTILVMLHSQDPAVQTNSLILLKTLCTHQLACRRAILSSPKFIAELGALLFSPDLSVVRVACEMMMVLGAEDQFTLRQLVEAMESSVQHTTSIFGNKVMYRFGQTHTLHTTATVDEEEDLLGLSIKSRLIDIANGILSTQSISEEAFTLSHHASTPLPEEIHELLHTLPSLEVNPRQERVSYTTEYVSQEGMYYEEPRYLQDIKQVANLAANVLAAMTGPPLGILSSFIPSSCFC
jgi:hypothetical protein